MTTTDPTRANGLGHDDQAADAAWAEAMRKPVTMRAFCDHCGSPHGTVTVSNGQNVVRCAGCGKYQYCAPKAETGQRPLSLEKRIGVKPKIRAEIIRAWDHRCAFCGTDAIDTNGGLHLAHLIDRKEAARHGLLDELIDDPINLVPACAACNLGESHLDGKHIKLIVRFLIIAHRRQREARA